VSAVVRVTNTTTGAGDTTSDTYLPRVSGDPADTVGRTRSVAPAQQASQNGTTYAYDGRARVVRTIDAVGNTRSSSYTSNDDVAALTDGLSAVTTLTYDARNNLTRVQAPGGGGLAGVSRVLRYSNTAEPFQPSGTTDSQGNCASYRYDANGNRTDTFAGQTGTCDTATAGSRTRIGYHGLNAVTCGGKTGQVCTETDPRGKITRYTYSAAGDLLSIAAPAAE